MGPITKKPKSKKGGGPGRIKANGGERDGKARSVGQ